MSGVLFTRLPRWLRNALNTQEQRLPNQLQAGCVESVLDVGQGGWGDMAWFSGDATVGPGAGAGTQVYAAANDVEGFIVMSGDVLHTGGVGPLLVAPQCINQVTGVVFNFAEVSVAVGDLMPWAEIAAGASYWVVPPKHGFQVAYPATGAGETLRMKWLIGAFRAGYKPI